MNSSHSTKEHPVIYSFDDYILDAENRTLRHGQRAVELTPKQFHTLLVLVENRDHVMSKDELLSSIWPEQFVEEANITQNISILRKVLGGTARGKKYIETFPGHGYKFTEPVAIERDSRQENAEDIAGRSISTENVPLGRSPNFDHSAQSAPAAKQEILSYRRYWVIAVLCLGIGALVSAIVLRWTVKVPKQKPAAFSSSVAKTLTRMDGAASQPSWSQDGKNIAFVYSSPDGSQSAIYIQSLQDARPRRVVYGTGKYSSPVWSPDGKFLAYLRIQPNDISIFILNVALSTETQLTTLFPHRYGINFRHLDWSPDGRMLVVDDKTVESDPLNLYLVSVSNGNKIRLTYPSMDIIGDVSPRFSPDGTQVAFIRMKYRFQYDVFVVPVTGGEPHRLTEQSGILGDVDWETNQSLIFSGKEDGEFHFWRLNLKSPQPRPVLASSLESDVPPEFSISRNSHQVVFSAYHPDLNIWALNLSKDHDSDADWTRVIQTPGQDIAPAFSPDGKKISFRSDDSGKMQIWVSQADGSEAFQVDTGDIIPAVHCWAPNGESILLSPRSSLHSIHGVYDVSLLGKFHLRQITSSFSDPRYSIDGKWIFARTHNVIYRVPAAGGTAVQITDQGGSPIVQSKDGRYLYFGHDRTDMTISRLDLKTKQQKVIIRSLMPGYRDSWALTSDGIYYLSSLSDRPMILFHDFATGKEKTVAVFQGGVPPIGMSGFSVSPDGRRLLVVRADPVSANIQTTTF